MLSRISRSARSIVIVVVVLVLGGWYFLSRPQGTQTNDAAAASADERGELRLNKDQVEALGLQTAQAVVPTALPIAGLPAEVTPPLNSSARVVAPYGGVVTRIIRDDGDVVAANEALVRIQSRDFLAAQAELVRARSEAEAARQQAQRDEQLLQEGIIARSRYEESRARAMAAEAARQQAQGGLSGLRAIPGAAAGEYELLAPMAGRVLRRNVTPGQAVAAMEETFALAAPGGLDLVFSVAIDARSRVAPGMQVRLPDGSLGRIVAVGAQTDRASQRLRVRARADNDQGLVAGQQVELSVLAPAPADSIAIPNTALVVDGDGHVIYVLRDQTYRAVRVQWLGGDASQAIVRGDVRAGEHVVSQGASALKTLLAAE